MGTFDAYRGLPLRGGFLLISIHDAPEPLIDGLNRPAFARTTIIGMNLEVELSATLPAEEISITLYHEVLEAASVASPRPPPAVCELNEAGFESAARRMEVELGPASPATLNRMLELFGF